MFRRKRVLATVIGFALATTFSGTVLAGEITGNDKATHGPANANSICVFSGQNDDPDAPLVLDFTLAPNGPGGIAQSYGQNVKLGASPQNFNPGDACRGGSNFARQR